MSNIEASSVEETPTPASRIPAAEMVVEDLTMIEGIGPKVNRVLRENGISSFKDLANADTSWLREILDKAGFQYMDPGTWAEQVGLIADNRMEEFQGLIENLKGGRKTN